MKYTKIIIVVNFVLFTNFLFNGNISANAISLSFQEDKQQQYQNHIESGDKLYEEGRYKEALLEYQKASKIMPLEEEPRTKIQACETAIQIQKSLDTSTYSGKDGEKIHIKIEELAEGQETSIVSSELLRKKDSIKKSILSKYDITLKEVKQKDNQEKVKVYSNVAEELKEAQIHDKALEYYNAALEIEEKEGNKKNVAEVLDNIAEVYLDSGDYHSTVNTFEKSIGIKEELGDKDGVAKTVNELATVYEKGYDLKLALDAYQKSLELKEEINDKEGIQEASDKIGDVFYKQQNLNKSIDSYEKSLKISEELDNKTKLGTTYNKIGVAYAESGDFEKAEDYFKKSLELKKSEGNNKEASMTLNNLGNLNYGQQKYKDAINYYQKSLDLKKDTDYAFGEALTSFNLGKAYIEINDIDKAIIQFLKSQKLSEENGFEELLAKNYKILVQLYEDKNDTDKELMYKKLLDKTEFVYVDVEEPVNESSIIGEVSEKDRLLIELTEELRIQREKVREEAAIRKLENQRNLYKLRAKELLIKRQRIILVAVIGGLILVLCLLGLIYYQMIQKKKANKILSEKNQLISRQAQLITDNIKSASAIQRAAMPPDDMLQVELPVHFILNMPKDIVSGDFYWMERREDKIFVAVADCTGHGVQGAVVSMLGMALLNEIVNKRFIEHPGQILSELSTKLKEALHSGGDHESIREGMDIVLLKFDRQMKNIEFAGAHNPLYIIRNNEIIEYKGDRSPIGYYSKGKKFTNQVVELKKGDSLYMFSDGYADQIGGEALKKFLNKRFKQLLLDINTLSMDARKKILVERFHEWRGDFQQVDDVMVMCIQV